MEPNTADNTQMPPATTPVLPPPMPEAESAPMPEPTPTVSLPMPQPDATVLPLPAMPEVAPVVTEPAVLSQPETPIAPVMPAEVPTPMPAPVPPVAPQPIPVVAPAPVAPTVPINVLPPIPPTPAAVPPKKSRKGLIIALIIIVLLVIVGAVVALLAASTAGINSVQNASRDNARRQLLSSMAVDVNAEYSDNAAYPTEINVNSDASGFMIGQQIVSFTGGSWLTPAAGTTATTSRYCYASSAAGFMLGVKLEDGTWYNLGSTDSKCDDSSTPVVAASAAAGDTSLAGSDNPPSDTEDMTGVDDNAPTQQSTEAAIAQAQLAERDINRKNTLQNLNLAVATYYSDNAHYPDNLGMGTGVIVVGGSSVEVPGSLAPSAATSTSATAYCYAKISDSNYKLGVKLESGEWFNVGNATAGCSDSDAALQ